MKSLRVVSELIPSGPSILMALGPGGSRERTSTSDSELPASEESSRSVVSSRRFRASSVEKRFSAMSNVMKIRSEDVLIYR